MEVKVYSTPSCPYCNMVKNYLRSKGIKFVDYDVSKDERKAMEMVRISGQMGVPVVVINGKVIVGFNKPMIDRMLNLS
ncbi:MAG: Uxx-star family glutaredoxin-like (seleno)protein [Spirochaetia bacterium]|nr:glutathione S-transferase N-terminal domain-containing protein [Spirochaetota bacterium]MCX8096997.1 glutathione S-transferase N-terminal domain-containing protein [Spirochaetota bacterium]MDW8111920.1 Uxx-star family glutaredoxin-like (seleno)protein [Spirochaetia bacterium]